MDTVNMSVEITSRETIKPSSPTPHILKTFKLSLLDQLSPYEYVPMIFFYPANPSNRTTTAERINQLKISLSQILTQFYPLAGRVRDNIFIDCNDEGVEFLEAKVLNRTLSDVLRQSEVQLLDKFLPNVSMEVQLGIQINVFCCGGMAISIKILHKIVDGITFLSVINMWAATARGSDSSFSPIFVGPNLFPPRDLSGLLPVLDVPKTTKCVTKKFVFDGSEIASLKEKIVSSSSCCVEHPSRVEIVSALIWKCAMDVSVVKSGALSPSVLTHAVNLRSRMDPPLLECASGNLIWLAIAPAPPTNGSLQMELHDLIYQIRNAIRKFDAAYVRKLQGEEGLVAIGETLKEIGEMTLKNVDIYRFTSWAKSFYEDADFGWGKPVWVSSAGLAFKNVVILMETRVGKGIEALVTLEEQDMAIFERNQDLLHLFPQQTMLHSKC